MQVVRLIIIIYAVMSGPSFTLLLLATLAPLAAAAPAPQKILVQYDQFKVPREPTSGGGGTQTNVTGLIEWLRDTHANAFSFLLWDIDGADYLDFVRVLSLTGGVSIDDVPLRMVVTLIPPSEARPGGTNDTQCSVPADSPLTSFNESALFNASLGNRGCLDFVAWCDVLSRLGRRWPHLDAVNIDDFSSNTASTFTQPYLTKMRAALAGVVRLIPTFYYGHGPKDFTLDTRPYLRNLTDGCLFYFRNDREGQQGCAASACGTPGCSLPCLDGACAERSVPNLPVEIADVASRLPSGHPLLVGIYFTAYHGCSQPSVDYNREVLAAALALPSVAGVTIYTTMHPKGQPPAACTAASSDKGCVVRLGFGGWNATVAARSFSPKCPPALPFLAPAAADASAGERRCCGSTASFPTCAASTSCCLDAQGCSAAAGIPACFCPSAQPYEYGNALGGYYCCANQSGFPTRCRAGGECCLRPGLKDGCQGRKLCGASAAAAEHLAAATADNCHLSNGIADLAFSPRGLTSWTNHTSPLMTIVGDDFALRFNDSAAAINSTSLPTPTRTLSNSTHCVLRFTSQAHEITIDVLYHLRPAAAFVSKTLTLTSLNKKPHNLTYCAPFAGTRLLSGGGVGPKETPLVVKSHYGLHDYAAFVRWDKGFGALLTMQNPYLSIQSAGSIDQYATTVGFAPDLAWRADAPLVLDSGILGVHELSGRILVPPADPIDEAEQASMVAALRAYLVAPGLDDETVKINIAWTENDYQLDISLASDREMYKRIIDRASQFGITHILFAPRNSDVSSKRNNTDAWGWEQILWFGMGQKLRMGEYTPGDPLPASLKEMLAHFKLRNVKPVAYVYPILAFLANTGSNGTSPPWIVPGTYYLNHSTDGARPPLYLGSEADAAATGDGANGPMRACLASPELQEWLPKTMLAFARATGAGGFSFDYTYFEQHGPFQTFYASQYAQWAGWRTILARLHGDKTACGGAQCVVDNRQQNHAWGPWMWVQGGTYAEPLMSDEQPGSWMFFEADLSTDRLSANRQREVAWSYRQLEFCPAESLPGFAYHQTDRDVTPKQKAICGDGRCSNASRSRDFDLLGHRYSLLSSIGTAGLNNVLCYLPARDKEEFDALPKDDISFVHDWLSWADANIPLLRTTRVLPNTSVPSFGSLDGVSMVGDDGVSGALFLYNPSSRAHNYTATFDVAMGVHCLSSTGTLLRVRLAGNSERTWPGPSDLGIVSCGGSLEIVMRPTTASVLFFEPHHHYHHQSATSSTSADLIVVGGGPATARLVGNVLLVDNAQGEAGTPAALTVLLPSALNVAFSSVRVNGRLVHFARSPTLLHGVHATALVHGVWGDGSEASPRFGRNTELCPGGKVGADGKNWTCDFTVPPSVLDQLKARNQSFHLHYDLDVHSTNDANTAWLAPGRLLVWVKYRSLLNHTLNVTGTLDGTTLLVRKAYNTIVPSASRFIGHFTDITPLLNPGNKQTLSLELPTAGSYQIHEGALSQRAANLEVINTTVANAQAVCAAHPSCAGLTFRKPASVSSCEQAASAPGNVTAYLKLESTGNGDAAWCTIVEPPKLVGVFVANVETVYTKELTQL